MGPGLHLTGGAPFVVGSFNACLLGIDMLHFSNFFNGWYVFMRCASWALVGIMIYAGLVFFFGADDVHLFFTELVKTLKAGS
jgi:hypothetical protein